MALIATRNKIIPHLVFDTQAVEAARFYAAVFPASSVRHTATIRDTPSGDCDLVSFALWNQDFMAISAGPLFKPNPSVSFIVNFDPGAFGAAGESGARAALDTAWKALSQGGKALMPLDSYFFSKQFGWVQDKYGVSWQLVLMDPGRAPRPAIVPSLMFIGANAGKADEAIRFYLSVFRDSQMGDAHRYGADAAPDKEGTLMFADFQIENQWFAAMDSAHEHAFSFNEGVSLLVRCSTQEEIDYYWAKLSADPASEQCGWLKDKFGLSWQIAPAAMEDMMARGTPEQLSRLTQAFLPMKKMNLAVLMKAFG
jgi:predicted 3-demethylubiquinone-9 3-methyltransferase (glyoxalase superfamily)